MSAVDVAQGDIHQTRQFQANGGELWAQWGSRPDVPRRVPIPDGQYNISRLSTSTSVGVPSGRVVEHYQALRLIPWAEYLNTPGCWLIANPEYKTTHFPPGWSCSCFENGNAPLHYLNIDVLSKHSTQKLRNQDVAQISYPSSKRTWYCRALKESLSLTTRVLDYTCPWLQNLLSQPEAKNWHLCVNIFTLC